MIIRCGLLIINCVISSEHCFRRINLSKRVFYSVELFVNLDCLKAINVIVLVTPLTETARTVGVYGKIDVAVGIVQCGVVSCRHQRFRPMMRTL